MEEIRATSEAKEQSEVVDGVKQQTFRLEDAVLHDSASTTPVVFKSYSYIPHFALGKKSSAIDSCSPNQCKPHCQDHGDCPGFDT